MSDNENNEERALPEFDSYPEALEAAADLCVEIKDVFKPQQARQKKIFEGIFDGRKGKDLNFVRDMLLYQAGYPNEDSVAKIEKFRDQLCALVESYSALGLLGNLSEYLMECGVSVDTTRPPVYMANVLDIHPKVAKAWDVEFHGEEVPLEGVKILKKILDQANTVQRDINDINDEIADIVTVAEGFGISKGAFKQALAVKIAEKVGKSVEEKIEAIEEKQAAVNEALKPFFPEVEDES